MKVALIGYGYWGINLARTITNTEGLELVSIFDMDIHRIAEAKKLYDFIVVTSMEELFNLDIEAVFIATPPASHFEVAKKALLAKKHIFMEKPFTLSLDTSLELIDIAEKNNLKFMVDHVFAYSEPVKYIKETIHELGDMVYINSRRINLGLFQYTTDVIWDLAVHDLSIIDYLVGLDVEKVSVFKKKYKDFPNEAIANIDLELKSGVVVNINVSWLSPVKVREMIIGGTKKSIVYDDTLDDKIKVYDAGVVLEKEFESEELYKHLVEYNYGDTYTPKLPDNQSLNNAVEHFRDCVLKDIEPITGKKSIINVIKTLELISKV
jgi:predicted dehydrogenase